MNLVPQELRRPGITLPRVLLVLVVVAAGILSFNYAQQRTAAAAEVSSLEVRLGHVESALEEANKLAPEADELRAAVETLRGRVRALEADYQRLLSRRVDWAVVIDDISGLLLPGMSITSLEQDKLRATLKGTARSNAQAEEYYIRLNTSEAMEVGDLHISKEGPPFLFSIEKIEVGTGGSR